MNPILSILGGGKTSGYSQIMMQAVKAAWRGDSPEDFMKDLAKTRPELQGLNLDDLETTANSIAQRQGKDINTLKGQMETEIKKFT